MDTEKSSYFVAKVDSFGSLKRCIEKEQWACRDRAKPPHPRDILESAFSKEKVILIFSVVNNHGWHGFAEMVSKPSAPERAGEFNTNIDEESKVQDKVTSSTKDTLRTEWHYFQVKWKLNFIEFGEQTCLFSKETEHLVCEENGREIPINKCRNWQELNVETGKQLCSLMQSCFNECRRTKEAKIEKALANIPKPFFTGENTKSVTELWQGIVRNVEADLGKVLLACPFGSQRYNLQTPESDTDMFIVYQAKTRDMLGFHPPKQTIKNHETEMCDYTIHEVYRYCELLLQGDARCVETLFLHESTVVQDSPEWQDLIQGRKLFLNKDCLDKYMRDAQGSKGTKYLLKWCKDNPQATRLNPKMCKMLYVIVRLLQNARNIVLGEELCVYREVGTPERQELMQIRAGNVPVQHALDIINRLESTIQQKSESVPDTRRTAEEFLENWLISLRYSDLQTH